MCVLCQGTENILTTKKGPHTLGNVCGNMLNLLETCFQQHVFGNMLFINQESLINIFGNIILPATLLALCC